MPFGTIVKTFAITSAACLKGTIKGFALSLQHGFFIYNIENEDYFFTRLAS